MANKEKPTVLQQVFVAVVVALLAGGTAPWWWSELFPREAVTQQVRPDAAPDQKTELDPQTVRTVRRVVAGSLDVPSRRVDVRKPLSQQFSREQLREVAAAIHRELGVELVQEGAGPDGERRLTSVVSVAREVERRQRQHEHLPDR